jgi:Fe2+ transport system protein FeoA
MRLIRSKFMPENTSSACPIPLATRETLSLLDARCGERLRVVDLKRDCATSARLRELGFCESAEVCKVVAQRGACICLLAGTRVAIGQDLAAHVLVERVHK